jgi:hypothetical protein
MKKGNKKQSKNMYVCGQDALQKSQDQPHEATVLVIIWIQKKTYKFIHQYDIPLVTHSSWDKVWKKYMEMEEEEGGLTGSGRLGTQQA